jgi:putative ABC transport system permease protein
VASSEENQRALAYVLAQQTREIGLRMVLGARPRDVLRSILSRGARLAVTGSGLGLTVALGLMRLLKTLLHGVSPFDPITLASVVTLLTVVGLIASLVPAYRAARIDPIVAPRCE